MSQRIVPTVKKRQIIELADSGKRMDGRTLTDYREIKIQTGIVDKAEGSAMVSIGGTKVVAGVKFEIGDPFPDIPNEGVMQVGAEFVPFASPDFEPGKPDEVAVELARVVDRGLRESKILETSKLCLIPGKKVWIVHVDVYILDHCGNLIDTAALAALSAMLTATMPEAAVEGENIRLTGNRLPMPITGIPINVTLAKIGNRLFVDPSLEEEEVLDCRFSVAFKENGMLCAIQKGESGYFTPEEILRAVEIAKDKSQEIRKKVVELLKLNDGAVGGS
ncbi:MAG: exosome complex protein Rrp42 [Candidatus Verstraetearchaeota archaeon]|nr:exosome complex protein Rrp42 [Candidatus Verstraetearchaeota archaeon]